MPPALPSARTLKMTSLTLALGAAGGLAFLLAAMPAAWLSGSMTVVAAAALFGAPVGVPNGLRDVIFVFLGVSMGSGVTPDVIAQIALWPASIAILSLTVLTIIAAGTVFLMRVGNWNRATAFFASIPGALSTVLSLAFETNADVRRVAISQSVRVFILVALMPTAIGLLRDAPLDGTVDRASGSFYELAALIACGLAGSLLFRKLGIPGAMLTGALFASAILHVSELAHMQMPQWLLIPGYVVLGSMIGTRFMGATWQDLAGMVGISLASFLIAMALSLIGAFCVVLLFDLAPELTLLAFAPGGLEAMMVMAFALHLDPAYVAAHQVFRFIAMALLLPVGMRLMKLERRETATTRDGHGS